MDKVLLCNQAEELTPLPFNEVKDFPPFTLLPASDDGSNKVEEGEDPSLFPDEVYDDLPEPLDAATKCGRNPYDRMMILNSCLTTLSSTMTKKVHFVYQKRYRPNLSYFVICSPASGKARIVLSTYLIYYIHEEMLEETLVRKKEYMKKLAKWKISSAKTNDDPPEKPQMKMLILPVNSTLAALDSLIADNDGCGLLFTPDGGNMMTAIGSEYGNYVNDLLASAENEGISRARKTDDELTFISETRFSVLVASTWEQIAKLFGTGDDGSSSRPMFQDNLKWSLWESQWTKDDKKTDEDTFRQLGREYMEMYKKLMESDDVEVTFSSVQKKQFDRKFKDLAFSYVKIYGERFLPSVRRMAVSALRIMSVLTILRALNATESLPRKVECSDQDFNRAMLMVETLLIHSGHIFLKLKSPSNQNLTNTQGWNLLYNALPDKFQRCEAIKTGNRLGIKNQRIDKYLHRLCDENKLRKLEFGVYQKVK